MSENEKLRPADMKAPKPDEATLRKVLDYLVNDPVLANAMRAVGRTPNLIFTWAKQSREGREQFQLRWPDPEGSLIAFHDGIVVARQMQCAHFESTLRRDVTTGTPRVLRRQDGEVIFEQDYLLMAEWEGDAEAARKIGGHKDPFFAHDQDGARVPVIVFDSAPAALRQHAARSLLAGFNPSNVQEIDTKLSGGVMIVKATRQGPEAPPLPALNAPAPYSRAAMAAAGTGKAAEGKAVTPLQQDLLDRLETLRARGPAHSRPVGSLPNTGASSVGTAADDGPPRQPPAGSRKIA